MVPKLMFRQQQLLFVNASKLLSITKYVFLKSDGSYIRGSTVLVYVSNGKNTDDITITLLMDMVIAVFKTKCIRKRCAQYALQLTHRGWVTQICVGNVTIIGPDNGLPPGRCQAIIWINAVILLIAKRRPFYLGRIVLITCTSWWYFEKIITSN